MPRDWAKSIRLKTPSKLENEVREGMIGFALKLPVRVAGISRAGHSTGVCHSIANTESILARLFLTQGPEAAREQ